MLVWPLMTWFDPWPLCSSPLFMHVILIILAGDLRGPPKWKQTSLPRRKSGANTSDQTPVHAEIWHLGNMNHSHTSVHIWPWCGAVITMTRTEKKSLESTTNMYRKKANLLFVSKKVKVLMRDVRRNSTKGKLERAARLLCENRPLLSLK